MEKSGKTAERIINSLKLRGAQSASLLAKEFDITVEAARLQLSKLLEDGIVEQIVNAKGVGRPTLLYNLTEKGNKYFPDTHPELSVQILSTVKNVLGQNALDEVINARAVAADAKYAEGIADADNLEEKLDRLVSIRNDEGYLAEWQKNDEGYLFIENHCPIGAAAKFCNGFCNAELNTLSNVLGPSVTVERTEHMMANSRRCIYKIIEK